MVTDHKNLEYFTTTKKLTQRQVRWSEYLSHFNAKICFRLGSLGTKPDTLTCHWDVYQEDGKTTNSTANIQPIFTTEHIAATNITAFANSLTPPESPYTNILDHATILDIVSSSTPEDPFARSMDEKIIGSELSHGWSWQADRLYFEGCLYIPDHQDLHLQIIHNHHDHPIADHFSNIKTIDLIRHNFHWPGLG